MDRTFTNAAQSCARITVINFRTGKIFIFTTTFFLFQSVLKVFYGKIEQIVLLLNQAIGEVYLHMNALSINMLILDVSSFYIPNLLETFRQIICW